MAGDIYFRIHASVTLWAFLSQVPFKNEQRSCAAAGQSIAASRDVIVQSGDTTATLLVEAAWANPASHVIGKRRGRVEPRAVKRRPKPHDLLTEPRAQARAELIAATWEK